MLQDKVQYVHWYCGHIHCNETMMEKHTILYEKIISVGEYRVEISLIFIGEQVSAIYIYKIKNKEIKIWSIKSLT